MNQTASLNPPQSNVRWASVVALYVGLAMLYCWPLLLSIDSALPNDTGDPGLIAWGMWWNSHVTPLTEQWWNAPIHFPLEGMLALSETFLGVAPLTSPLMWAGLDAVTTYNITFLLAIPTCGIATHALVYHLTGRHDAAFLAGLSFAFNPYRASQMPHLHLLVTCWMPLALLALHRFVEAGRRRDLVLFGVCWLLNGLTTGYYLIFFAVLTGMWLLWFARSRRDWISIGLAAGVASLPFIPILAGYKRVQGAFGFMRGRNEIESFSADLTGFLSASSHVWLPYHWTLPPGPEGELYPGAAIVLLTVAGVVYAVRHSQRLRPIRARRTLAILGVVALLMAWGSSASGGWRLEIGAVVLSLTRPHRIVTVGLWLLIAAGLCDRRLVEMWRRRSLMAFYALAAFVTAVLALGPVGRVYGVRFMHQAPYSWLMEFPGGDSLRVPARFAMLMMLCLACSAALAFVRFTPLGARMRTVVVLALLILADGWVPKLQMAPVQAYVNLPGLEPGTAVLELPMRDLYSDTAAMLRATVHGRPLVNGFSGYGPPHYSPLVEGLRAGDVSVIEALRELAPLVILVNHADDGERAHERFVSGAPEARLLYRTPLGPVFRFPMKPPEPPMPDERQLQVGSFAASVNREVLWALTDNNLATQWQTLGPQAPGNQLVATFAADVEVSRLEMDLGEAIVNYPRGLRIDARTSDGALRTVWSGGTAGLAVAGILRDRIRAPLTVFLPRKTVATELILTLTAPDKDFYWTVAEFRAFGRAR